MFKSKLSGPALQFYIDEPQLNQEKTLKNVKENFFKYFDQKITLSQRKKRGPQMGIQGRKMLRYRHSINKGVQKMSSLLSFFAFLFRRGGILPTPLEILRWILLQCLPRKRRFAMVRGGKTMQRPGW